MGMRKGRLAAAWQWGRGISLRVRRDRVTVYAAQASFFTILSVVPFLSLLIAVISFFLTADVHSAPEGHPLPGWMNSALGSLLADLQETPKVSLLSVSAVTTLWSASKGSAAIRAGIKTVYGADDADGFFLRRLKSLGYTLVFLVLIVASVALLLFGDFLLGLLNIPLLTRLVRCLRVPVFVLGLAALFTAMYAASAKGSRRMGENILGHLPGALFAAVGWVLFSWLYALYIRWFPNASYIYGSLAAVCLIMLWLYFCMVILLLGAEVNKLFHPSREDT